MRKKIFYILALSVVLLPSLAFAAPNIWPTGFWGPLVSCTGNGANGTQACSSLCDLVNTTENVIYFGISVALFIIMPILFAWGGLMFMFSRGKPEGISKAKSILTGAVVGLLIVLGAWLIVNTVVSVLGITGVGGFGTNVCTPAPGSDCQSSCVASCESDCVSWCEGKGSTVDYCNNMCTNGISTCQSACAESCAK